MMKSLSKSILFLLCCQFASAQSDLKILEGERKEIPKQDIRTQIYFRQQNSVWNRSVVLPNTTTEMGFFCKEENAASKNSKFAPRFRLGSVVYTEYMEGRKDYYLRNLQ